MLIRVGSDEGFTLVELIVAITMLMVAVTATFAALNGFSNATRANFEQNRAQSGARIAVDRMSRELRATASPGLPSSPIERAQADDLVFNTVDPAGPSGSNAGAVQRVRYCLDTGGQKLWRQVQTWSTAARPAMSTQATCPHSSFGSQAQVADHVVNGGNSTMKTFTYDSTSASSIGAITLEVFTDIHPTRAPGAQRLNTTIFLRNLNRPPDAGFSANLSGSRHVFLNAGSSTDADGDQLTYQWYDGSTLIGTGVLFDYLSPTTGSHTFTVTVTDSSGLSDTSPPQTVTVS